MFSFIDRNLLIERFLTLTSVDSPTYGERQMADTLISMLGELHLQAVEDDAAAKLHGNSGNLYAFFPGNLPGDPLLFSSHMDTVAPALQKKPRLHPDGRITGDGSTVLGGDDAVGLASILEAVRAIRENQLPHRGIEILFTPAEEVHCRGSRVFDYQRLRSRQAYVLDLTGPVGTAAYAAPSLFAFRAEFTGRAAHAGFSPEAGIHAVKLAAQAVADMQLGRIGTDTTVNIGRIEGGGETNIVPDRCLVTGEVRSYSHEGALAEVERIKNLFSRTAGKAGGACSFQSECAIHAYQVEETHPVAQRLKRACSDLKLPFSLTKTFGGSDNNNFFAHGIHGLVLAGAMHNAHSLSEYTTADELCSLAALTLRLMTDKA